MDLIGIESIIRYIEQMNFKYEEIVIEWTDKVKFTSMDDFTIIEDKYQGTNMLYQIYGDHHIYGNDVLIYIGISDKLRNRFNAHLNGVFNFVNNKSVSIGIISTDNFSEKMEVPESILIANHKAAFNKEYIHSIDPNALKSKIIIINNGNNGMLKTSCTNYWWVDNHTSITTEIVLMEDQLKQLIQKKDQYVIEMKCEDSAIVRDKIISLQEKLSQLKDGLID